MLIIFIFILFAENCYFGLFVWFYPWDIFAFHSQVEGSSQNTSNSCFWPARRSKLRLAAVPATHPPRSLPSHGDSTANDIITLEFFCSTCPIWQPAMKERAEWCLFLSALFYLSSTLGATVKSLFNHLITTSSCGPLLMKLTSRTTAIESHYFLVEDCFALLFWFYYRRHPGAFCISHKGTQRPV